jgi:broad specificity phosphatase PhoE
MLVPSGAPRVVRAECALESSRMPVVLLMRHAQASFGGDDYDLLSDRGHAQVRALQAELTRRGLRPARMVSGSMRRQLDTARPFGEPDVDPRWNEYDPADMLAAHSSSDLRPDRASGGQLALDARAFQQALDAGMEAWIAAAAATTADEPWPGFRGRVAGALDDFAGSLGKGETGFVFTSSGVIAACAVIALGVPDASMPAFNRLSVNASITKLLIGRAGPRLVSFNEHGHLEGDGDLVTFR